MANWLEYLDNPEAVAHLYDVAPFLGRVWLSSISLSDNTSVVLDTLQLPLRPPARWGQFNVVNIEFGLTDVSAVNIEGWPWERFVGVEVTRSNERIAFRVHGSGIDAELSCSHLRIRRLQGYMAEESWLAGFKGVPRE